MELTGELWGAYCGYLGEKKWPCYNDNVLYLQNALIVFSFAKGTCGCSLSNTQNCKNVINLIVLKILSRCCSIKRFDTAISMCKNTKCIEITGHCLGIGHDMHVYVFLYIKGDIISNTVKHVCNDTHVFLRRLVCMHVYGWLQTRQYGLMV